MPVIKTYERIRLCKIHFDVTGILLGFEQRNSLVPVKSFVHILVPFKQTAE